MHHPRPVSIFPTVAALALLLASCGTNQTPVPETVTTTALTTSEGVTFQPPIGKVEVLTGNFDPNVALNFEIFRLKDGQATGAPIGPGFSTTNGTIKVVNEPGVKEHYIATWSSKQAKLPNGTSLRVEVRKSDATSGVSACNSAGVNPATGCLGFFDVQLVKPPPKKPFKNIYQLVNGQALPIKLHINRRKDNEGPSKCPTLQLALTSAQPGERIPIAGVPQEWQNPFAFVRVEGIADENIAYIERSHTGSGAVVNHLITPFHPIQLIQGGDVEVVVTDGENKCRSLPLLVKPLPDPSASGVEGAFAERVNGELQSLRQQARDLGVDPAMLLGSVSDLPAEARILAIAQFFLDHPRNPQSLGQVLETGTTLVDGAVIKVDLSFLDSVFAHERNLEAQQLSGSQLRSYAVPECKIWTRITPPVVQAPLQTIEEALDCMDAQDYAESRLKTVKVGSTLLATRALPKYKWLIKAVGLAENVTWEKYKEMYPKGFVEGSLSFELRDGRRTFHGVDITSGGWKDVKIMVSDGSPSDFKTLWDIIFQAWEAVEKKVFGEEYVKTQEQLNEIHGPESGWNPKYPLEYSRHPISIRGPEFSLGSVLAPNRIQILSQEAGTFELTFQNGCGQTGLRVQTAGPLLAYNNGAQSKVENLDVCPVGATRSPDVLKLTADSTELVGGSITVTNKGHSLNFQTANSDPDRFGVSPTSGVISKGESVTFDILAGCKAGETEFIGGIGLDFTLPDGERPSVTALPGFPPDVLPVELKCGSSDIIQSASYLGTGTDLQTQYARGPIYGAGIGPSENLQDLGKDLSAEVEKEKSFARAIDSSGSTFSTGSSSTASAQWLHSHYSHASRTGTSFNASVNAEASIGSMSNEGLHDFQVGLKGLWSSQTLDPRRLQLHRDTYDVVLNITEPTNMTVSYEETFVVNWTWENNPDLRALGIQTPTHPYGGGSAVHTSFSSSSLGELIPINQNVGRVVQNGELVTYTHSKTYLLQPGRQSVDIDFQPDVRAHASVSYGWSAGTRRTYGGEKRSMEINLTLSKP